MKRKKRELIFCLSILFLYFCMPLIANGTDVSSVETNGTIGFTGIYEPIGLPEPPPKDSTKPSVPADNSSNNKKNYLPKTNDTFSYALFFMGVILVFLVSIIKFLKDKKKVGS